MHCNNASSSKQKTYLNTKKEEIPPKCTSKTNAETCTENWKLKQFEKCEYNEMSESKMVKTDVKKCKEKC